MMNRIFKRPMFRMGGRSDDGIMSLRPGFQPGGIVPGSILTTGGGVMPPGSGTTPSPISTVQRFFPPVVQQPAGVPSTIPTGGSLTTTGGTTTGGTTVPADRMFRAGQSFRKGLTGLQGLVSLGGEGVAAGTVGKGIAITAPILAVAALADENYPVYPKGHPEEGERMSLEDAQETLEKSGGAINIATKKGTQAGGAGDLSGEAAIFDESLPEESDGMLDIYGNMNYPTKRNFDSPEAIKVSKEIGLLPKNEGNGKNGNGKFDDDGLGDDGTSDFEKSLNEYLPAIESALEIDDEATKRQLFLQLAKFGAGLVAQPGGDLTGAIGRAALDPIEGVGKVLSDKQAAKRQAKLIAVQAAIKDMGPGSYGKNVQDIMKTFNLKGKEGRKQAGAIYNKILSNDSTALSRDRDDLSDTARNDLRLKGGAIDAYVSNIRALRQSDPELIGKFNKIITSEDKPTDKEYYVTEEGEFVRYDKKTDQFLQPGDDGFSDSKKKKK
jgi:hypothetical protein